MNSELVLVLDFGGQYNQLIARRVRECNVYAEVIPYTTSLEDIKAKNPKGIIFTGGPNSVYKEDSPSYDKSIFEIGVPPQECIVIEDSINGIKAGHAAGMKVVHVPDTIQIDDTIRALTYCVCEHLGEVPDVIEKLNAQV